MSNNTTDKVYRIIRLDDVVNIMKVSKQTVYSQMSEGVFPPSFPLGRNCVGWFSHEVEAILKARCTGLGSKEELKEVVKGLVDSRQSLFN